MADARSLADQIAAWYQGHQQQASDRIAAARGTGGPLDMSPEHSHEMAQNALTSVSGSVAPVDAAETGLAGALKKVADARKARLLQQGIQEEAPTAAQSIYQQGSPVVNYNKDLLNQVRR